MVGDLVIKVRASMVMTGAKESSATLVEVYMGIGALKSHAAAIETKLKATAMEERMLALEKVVKKSLEGSARKAAPLTVPRSGRRPTYASIVAPSAPKAAIIICVEGAENLQPAELLTKAQIHIKGVYAVRQLQSSDTEVFVHSVSQRDADLSVPQPRELKTPKQGYPVEVMGVSLETKIEGGKYANNGQFVTGWKPDMN